MATIIAPRIKTKQQQRNLLVVYLSLLLLAPVGLRFARIFAIPTRQPALKQIYESAGKLKSIVKHKKNIVWISEPISLYMAGRVSYYPLIHHTGFYKPSNDTETVRSLGFWNQEMLNQWLKEADLVVIGANKLKLLNEASEAISLAKFIENKLNYNFELIETRKDIWPGEMSFYQPKI